MSLVLGLRCLAPSLQQPLRRGFVTATQAAVSDLQTLAFHPGDPGRLSTDSIKFEKSDNLDSILRYIYVRFGITKPGDKDLFRVLFSFHPDFKRFQVIGKDNAFDYKILVPGDGQFLFNEARSIYQGIFQPDQVVNRLADDALKGMEMIARGTPLSTCASHLVFALRESESFNRVSMQTNSGDGPAILLTNMA